jgi:uncharacterized membrane protein YuzA (DUF378 family)
MKENDMKTSIFGSGAMLSRVVYGLVGLCGLYQAIQWKGVQRRWGAVEPALV